MSSFKTYLQESEIQDKQREVSIANKLHTTCGISLNSAKGILFGGTIGTGDVEKLVSQGYNDGATSFEENKNFWKKCGITKADINFAVKRSM